MARGERRRRPWAPRYHFHTRRRMRVVVSSKRRANYISLCGISPGAPEICKAARRSGGGRERALNLSLMCIYTVYIRLPATSALRRERLPHLRHRLILGRLCAPRDCDRLRICLTAACGRIAVSFAHTCPPSVFLSASRYLPRTSDRYCAL